MKIRRGQKISRNDARQLIFALARYSNHYRPELSAATSDGEIRKLFEREGCNFERVIEDARSNQIAIPIVANLVGGQWIAQGATVSKIHADGHEERMLSGDGAFSPEPYLPAFEAAIKLLTSATENFSIQDLLSASERAVSSVNGFVAERAEDWNRGHPTDQLIDNSSNKVPFDTKIDAWIPKMTGKKLDKSGKNWSDFRKLRQFRDQFAAHQSGRAHGITRKEVIETANLFKHGLAGLLFDMHKLFEIAVPSRIIQEAYAPSFIEA